MAFQMFPWQRGACLPFCEHGDDDEAKRTHLLSSTLSQILLNITLLSLDASILIRTWLGWSYCAVRLSLRSRMC